MNCVTQKLKTLTKKDLTAELVGKEIVCLDNTRYADATINKKYKVMSVSSNFFMFSDDTGYPCDYVIASPEDFALYKDQECKPVTVPDPEGYDWTAEITHSCTLEFPNGEIVIIPGPEGNNWNVETTRFDWPTKHYKDLWAKLQLHDVKHNNGKLIFKEYAIRMHNENARIVSITKWTRDPNYRPPEREETFEERAIRRYPSRMRGQG